MAGRKKAQGKDVPPVEEAPSASTPPAPPIPHPNGEHTLPAQVRAEEAEYLEARRLALPGADAGPLFGLALSGGGIRSATFALGVAQAFARRGLLRCVDYLATVSGGGYLGACLGSLLTPPDPAPTDLAAAPASPPPSPWKAGLDGRDPDRHPLLSKQQIHHLRTHGDFLIVRKGLFRLETLRVIGTIAVGTAATLLFFASFLLVAVPLFLGFGILLVGGGWWSEIGDGRVPSVDWYSGWPWVVVLAVAGGLVAWIAQLGLRAAAVSALNVASPGGADAIVSRALRLVAGLCLALPILLIALVDALLRTCDGGCWRSNPTAVLHPLAWSAGMLLGFGIAYLYIASVGYRQMWDRHRRSLGQGATAVALLAVAFSVLGVGLACLTAWLGRQGLHLSLPSLGGVALVLVRVATKDPNALKGARAQRSLWSRFGRPLALAVAVPVLVVTCVLLLLQFTLAQGAWWPWWALGEAALGGLLFLALMRVDFNRISPHSFYRDRLTDAYLRTDSMDPDHPAWLRNDGSLDLPSMVRDGKGLWRDTGAPYLLIQAAINLPGSRDLARRNRKSDHFLFSPLWCGSRSTGFVPTHAYAGGRVKLAKAMTVSGAAAASSMGLQTAPAQAFAMTLFNVRLGHWLPNPARYVEDVGGPQLPWPKASKDGVALNPTFWPRYLVRELMASVDEQAAFVNVSDGGHTGDNLALYPLLQRRCRLIVVSDAECDPEYDTGSLASAIRQIFTDENVQVDIDVSPIRPAPEGADAAERARERCAFVVGCVRYPRSADDPPSMTDAEREAYVVFVKAAFYDRDEPLPVRSYAHKHPDFPQQSTTDQFFDDDQFEAYRALGEHIASRLCDDATLPSVASKTPGSESTVLYEFARKEWGRLRKEREARRGSP